MQLLPRPQRENKYLSHLEPDKVERPRPLRVEKNNFPDENSQREITAGSRVAVFIDGANLFYAAMHLHIEVDYTKLLRCLAKERQLLRAYFYTAIDSTNDKQQGFILWMRRNGYRVVAKELIQFPDGSKKASLDVEIAVDMMTLAKHCDTLVLLSGDGDLAYAVDNVSYRGAQVEVVSLRSMTSDTLINVADCYTDLEYLKPEIQKT
ncbi:MAG: NYN domain-containing protein [Scytonematopsis contorta HA4267-MV1]|jgi:uncharacterized LabA/DUF88 family protein|nr:NYN domain-containing protein [Scytonematopsis contorta HA4267-MV1]